MEGIEACHPAYHPDEQVDFLGEVQWQWFDEVIRRSPAGVNIMVTACMFTVRLQFSRGVGEVSHTTAALIRYVAAVEAPINGDVHSARAGKGLFSIFLADPYSDGNDNEWNDSLAGNPFITS